MSLEVTRSIAMLRQKVGEWRRDGLSVGIVPTMGALHEGHLALVREAQRRTQRIVVTLFVNPTQFGPAEDLATYPREEDADRRKLAALGVDSLFAPNPLEMYPPDFDTKVLVGGPATGLEGEFRPHYFAGVATIVTKLLLSGLPDRAFFGEKDYQQLLVVKKVVRELNIPTEIVACPTVREADGLALSSRNAYLSAEERARAPRLYAVLCEIAARLKAGAEATSALDQGRRILEAEGFAVDYLALRHAETFQPIREWSSEPSRLLAAARLGSTRLIDNIGV